MKYLLDTIVWFWSVSSFERIGMAGREILGNGREEVYLSAVTGLEVSIKMRLGKMRLMAPPAECIPAFMAKQGLRPLMVTHSHAVKVYDLPLIHRDPFDRLIIAQAMAEGMCVLTADRVFEKYPVDVLWCGS
ncbi:MAG TPA: type II toxin-antitoxin system VapC family toxin [Terriglobales bacterium]|nr:type II toxin-antitoxin system VapC family toxin [Terriglobales bacterium]